MNISNTSSCFSPILNQPTKYILSCSLQSGKGLTRVDDDTFMFEEVTGKCNISRKHIFFIPNKANHWKKEKSKQTPRRR